MPAPNLSMNTVFAGPQIERVGEVWGTVAFLRPCCPPCLCRNPLPCIRHSPCSVIVQCVIADHLAHPSSFKIYATLSGLLARCRWPQACRLNSGAVYSVLLLRVGEGPKTFLNSWHGPKVGLSIIQGSCHWAGWPISLRLAPSPH